MSLHTNDVVVCSILRAGLPLHNGLLNYFDVAGSAYISAYRKHSNNSEFEIKVEYFASLSLEGKTLISVFEALKTHDIPKEIHLACVLGSTEGVEFIKNYFPEKTILWIATVDEKLKNKGYIVPSLSDAGDLAFGKKL